MHQNLRFLFLVSMLFGLAAVASPAAAASCFWLEAVDGYVCREDTQHVELEQFGTPGPPEDTLFGRRWYGRLADNAIVYSQPLLWFAMSATGTSLPPSIAGLIMMLEKRGTK